MFNQDGEEVLLADSEFFSVVREGFTNSIREQYRNSMSYMDNKHVLEAFDNMTCAVASWAKT